MDNYTGAEVQVTWDYSEVKEYYTNRGYKLSLDTWFDILSKQSINILPEEKRVFRIMCNKEEMEEFNNQVSEKAALLISKKSPFNVNEYKTSQGVIVTTILKNDTNS